jgi:hypothetical protein
LSKSVALEVSFRQMAIIWTVEDRAALF